MNQMFPWFEPAKDAAFYLWTAMLFLRDKLAARWDKLPTPVRGYAAAGVETLRLTALVGFAALFLAGIFGLATETRWLAIQVAVVLILYVMAVRSNLELPVAMPYEGSDDEDQLKAA